MPNARKKGTKSTGVFIEEEKIVALDALALKKGYKDKAAMMRVVYDEIIAGRIKVKPPDESY